MSRLMKFRREHARLTVLAKIVIDMIDAESPPPVAQMQSMRHALETSLIAHLQAEDWLLYPDLLDSRDPVIVATARSFHAEMGDLARTFLDYSERWMLTPPADDWTGFCRETRTIIDALLERIDREDRFLYPLLEPLERAA